MFRVFLSSHGHLASAFRESLSLFCGELPNLTTYDAYVDDETTVSGALDTFFQTVAPEDYVLLISDIYGGSVNNEMVPYLTRPNVRLVAGLNLSFLIEVMSADELTDDRLDEIVDESRAYLCRVELPPTAEGQGDVSGVEDFF